ncbi:ADP-ribosylglycohydrolase family protein [Aureispira anguillae]|uniref:ADP-ribosylglycohydrolase family protein n=1 Tax=Aureispira anguillae TaxID=2864201 RepID=A0A916DTK8_9BACT|nr:ADP-ribosylglycohydrolase family protein [Aureispira anguillae]BDS11561.1 ADP-ribosylglycohydrolase family protein [Aureispira anguillae]
MKPLKNKDYIKGSLFGMAIGDGFGYPTEFLSISEIVEKWPPTGPDKPEGNPILVTDDTQMAIAVAKALMESENQGFSPSLLEQKLTKYYIQWLNDPKNNRAPGMTCIRACERLEKGLAWEKSAELNSKGCGANMRVVPVGLLSQKGLSENKIGAIAQFQSALTHAHPTALAASEITAITIAKLINGVRHQDLLSELLNYSEKQKKIYHRNYLKEIWDRPPFRTPEEYITLGWEQVIDVLLKVKEGLRKNETKTNPCLISGEGWIAEEAFATALLCFLLFPQSPTKVLKRAVVTSGDSDSIACLAGAFSGAYCGLESFPIDWVNRVEYKKDLESIAAFYKQ